MSDLINRAKEALNENKGKMIDELVKIAEFKNHPETELLEFEIHDLRTIILYPMTKDGDQVGGIEEDGFFTGHYKIPINIKAILNEYNPKLFDDLCIDHSKDVIVMIIEWFSDCWDVIKDKVYLPTYISPHDSVMLFDLSNKRWRKTGEQYG